MTDQCVESAVRDACDLGYLVTLVTDGCTTSSAERHEQSLLGIRGYCRQRCTSELPAEIAALIGSRLADGRLFGAVATHRQGGWQISIEQFSVR